MMHVYIDTRGAPVRAVQRAARTEAPRLRDFVAASRRHKVGELRERRSGIFAILMNVSQIP